MKKALSVICVLTLLVSGLILPVSDTAAVVNKVLVESFDSYPASLQGDTITKTTGLAGDGGSGIHYSSAANWTPWINDLAPGFWNWTGVKYFEIYVKNHSVNAAAMGLVLTDESQPGKEHWQLRSSAKLYMIPRDGSDAFVITSGQYSFSLPAGFDGIIRVAPDTASFEPISWATQDSLLNMAYISQVTPCFTAGDALNLTFDNISIGYDAENIKASPFKSGKKVVESYDSFVSTGYTQVDGLADDGGDAVCLTAPSSYTMWTNALKTGCTN